MTGMFTIDVNKVVVYVSCYNRRVWWYIVGYQVHEGTVTPLFIKAPKKIFSNSMSQCNKHSPYTISFNVFEPLEWVARVSPSRYIWNEIELQLIEKLITELIKWEGKYQFKTNLLGQDAP